MRSISRILVANRGEIARRIFRTARRLGYGTVAVYSDADANALHVKEADIAVHIGESEPGLSYLRIDAIIDAARRTGADAIHPGYGFLAENEAFAEACAQAGIEFIGPSPAAIRAMGSKRAARQLVAAAGLPVVPGYDGDDQSDERLIAESARIGYPLLVKASAGGGGKGMRIVREAAELVESISMARREAMRAFGDDSLLLERYVERPRHIEVQVLGDKHGNLIHLHERECSIQRRHQKVVEESPSPAINDELRSRICTTGVAIAKLIGYYNAGTVEMILAPDGEFYFLEVNTRLQVEHPVTEAITGIDLVEAQIHVAEGRELAWKQHEVPRTGHAIEVRICAEDPAAGFLPATGTVADWHFAPIDGFRLDTGIQSGSEITPFYDSMLAKLIVYGGTRDEAVRKLRYSLDNAAIGGLRTNLPFLREIIAHPAFAEGATHTHFIDDYFGPAPQSNPPSDVVDRAIVAAAIVDALERAAHATILPTLVPGFRNNRSRGQTRQWSVAGDTREVEYTAHADGRYHVKVGEHTGIVRVVDHGTDTLRLAHEDGITRLYRVVANGEYRHVHSAGHDVTLKDVPRFPEPGGSKNEGACIAPMPGKIVRVAVEVGAEVAAGALLVVLEAMKMEHRVTAAKDGTIKAIYAQVGDQVEADAVLVELE
jgi:acetyl-CoA carboxylase biotin carboxylase subunit